MNAIEYLHKWIEAAEFLVDQEDNPKYKREMWERVHHVKLNQNPIEKKLWEGHEYHTCNECGEIELNTFREPTKQQLKEKQLCFSCNLWHERAKEFDPYGSSFIIDGTLWTDGGFKRDTKGGFLGCAGRLFKIKTFDGREIVTNNLWCGGDVPKKYHQGSLKDTAVFI